MTRTRAAVAIVAALLAASAVFQFQLCPFAWLTGIPCPGCGLGRATLELARGHVHDAFRLHPLAPLALIVAAIAAIHLLRAAPRSLTHDRALTLGASTLLGVFLIVWVARFTGALGGPAPVTSIWSPAPRAQVPLQGR